MSDYARPLGPYLRLATAGAFIYLAYKVVGAIQAWTSPLFAALNFVLFLAAAVLGGIWFGRVGGNLDRLDRGDRTWSTALGVVLWYIPIVNLILPFLAIKEMAKASQGGDWRNNEAPSYINRLWALWAIGGALVIIGFFWGIAAGAEAILDAGGNQTAIEDASDRIADDQRIGQGIIATLSTLAIGAATPLYLRLCRDFAAWHDAEIESRYA